MGQGKGGQGLLKEVRSGYLRRIYLAYRRTASLHLHRAMARARFTVCSVGHVCACPMGTGVLLRRICSKIPTGKGTDRSIGIPFLRSNRRSCGMVNGTSGRYGIRIISSKSAQSSSCAAGPADASVRDFSPGCGELIWPGLIQQEHIEDEVNTYSVYLARYLHKRRSE